MPVPVEPLSINISQEILDDLHDRLRRTRWPGEVPGSGWNRGVDLNYMKELVEYWLDEYDWREQEARLNELPHFRADIDGLGVHFIHVKGNGPDPLPLFMMHGYPWSFVLLLKILPMLTDPAAYGGDPEDAFSVVIPSIIGFGLSDYPADEGFGFQHHPARYDRLMTEGLGYSRYGIEGGDWGGFLTAPWGYHHPDNLVGIHLNCLFPRLGDEREPQDKDPDILRGLGMKWAPVRPKDPDMLRYWKKVLDRRRRLLPSTNDPTADVSRGHGRFSRRSGCMDHREMAGVERLVRRFRETLFPRYVDYQRDALLGHEFVLVSHQTLQRVVLSPVGTADRRTDRSTDGGGCLSSRTGSNRAQASRAVLQRRPL